MTHLQIDQSFVRDTSTDHNDAAIISAVLAMAVSPAARDDFKKSALSQQACR